MFSHVFVFDSGQTLSIALLSYFHVFVFFMFSWFDIRFHLFVFSCFCVQVFEALKCLRYSYDYKVRLLTFMFSSSQVVGSFINLSPQFQDLKDVLQSATE